MPVDTRLTTYDDAYEDWLTIRHCLAGERWIKAGGNPANPERRAEDYLPRPSGMGRDIHGDRQYNAYKARAEFPDFVSSALRGLSGILFRKRARVDLPPRMAYLLDATTPDGLNFWGLERRIASDQLAFGRHILLPELPRDGERARILSYPPEVLINWREELIAGERKLTLAVLEIEQDGPSDTDEFKTQNGKEWLVLRLRDGIYMQDIWQQGDDDENPMLVEEGIIPNIRGDALPEIPLCVLGAIDLDMRPDERPLIGLCNTAIDLYQLSADYRQALFMVSQPTPYATGTRKDDEHAPSTIGSSTIWYLPDPQARAGFLEYTGAGVGSQRQAIMDHYELAGSQGAQMLETQKRQAEAAESLRLRQSARHATIQTVTDVLAEGLNKALTYVALWNDVDPSDVVYEPNTDFIETRMDPMELRELVAAWMGSAIPRSVLWHNLRQGEIIPNEMTDEELQSEVDGQPPIGLPRVANG